MKQYSEVVEELKLVELIQNHKNKLKTLCSEELFTEAFLSSYILIEHITMQLTHSHQAYQDSEKLTNRLSTKLKKVKGGIFIEQEELKILLFNSIFPHEKEKSNAKRNYINVAAIKKALAKLKINYNSLEIDYLLSDTLNKTNSEKLPSHLPRMTIRRKRNNIVHRNEEILKDYYNKTSDFFSYFFDLIESNFSN